MTEREQKSESPDNKTQPDNQAAKKYPPTEFSQAGDLFFNIRNLNARTVSFKRAMTDRWTVKLAKNVNETPPPSDEPPLFPHPDQTDHEWAVQRLEYLDSVLAWAQDVLINEQLQIENSSNSQPSEK